MIDIRDPGELLAWSDACARRASHEPGTPDRARLVDAREAVADAVAALDALLALIPEGQATVPEDAFVTVAGRAILAEDPARFQRTSLAARRAHLVAEGYAIRRRMGELANPAFHARTATLADTLVATMRTAPSPVPPDGMRHSLRAVRFETTEDPRHPYATEVDGTRWTVRLNEFPEEPSLYTLFVDGVVAEELMDWPAVWHRPD